jgi:hypothetical protein
MPEDAFWLAADYYLVRAATLCGPIRSLDEVGAHYRRHGANAYLSSGLDLEHTRTQIRLINDAHHILKQFAARIAFGDFPSSASDACDLRFFALRVASLRLEPAEHPLPGDRLLPLAMVGAAVALQQTHRTLAFRCVAAAWFAAMILAPRRLGWSLTNWFFFPANRPRGARPKALSPKVSMS